MQSRVLILTLNISSAKTCFMISAVSPVEKASTMVPIFAALEWARAISRVFFGVYKAVFMKIKNGTFHYPAHRQSTSFVGWGQACR